MSSTMAIIKASKAYQWENGNIWIFVYSLKLNQFLNKNNIGSSFCMFLNSVGKSLKVNIVVIKRSEPSWDAFLREITSWIVRSQKTSLVQRWC